MDVLLFGLFFVVIPFILGIMCTSKRKPVKSGRVEVSLKYTPVSDKSVFDEAKSILMDCGYTATESKKMLINVEGYHETPDQWATLAMRNVKI